MTQEELKEVGIDFEQELYKAFGQVKDFTLGMRIAKHFFSLGMAESNKELEEKRERFRLYGEICLLMEGQGEDIFDDYRIDRYELEDAFGEEIYVFEDAGDHGVRLDAIAFEEGMLWVEFGAYAVSFMCVSSDTLEQIYEVLKQFYEEK